MAKPPYIKTFQNVVPHVDRVTETINYRDFPAVHTVLYDKLASTVRLRHSHSSVSTKPWPNGKPPVWTNQTRSHGKVLADQASGSVVWTPGAAWPSVSTRIREGSGGFGLVFTPLGWRLPPMQFSDSDALDNKLRNKLNAETNAAVAIAEAQKSVDSVAKRLRSLSQALLAVKRGKLSMAAEMLGYPPRKILPSARRRALAREIVDPRYREFAKNWLELQYGWLPMISDIHGLLEYSKGKPAGSFIKASSSKTGHDSVSYSAGSNIDGGIGYHVETQQWTTRKSYTAQYSVDSLYMKRLSETGLINPLTVAWELVPFSFVVDWFLPVGDTLSALTATCGTSIKGCLYVETSTLSRQRSSSLRSASPSDSASGSGSFSDLSYSYARSVVNFPSTKFPSFKNPVSTGHAANALALVTSIFTKR